MKIALCQLNPFVGDLTGNTDRLVQTWKEIGNEHPDLIVFPELFLTGYPPQDLLERGWFIKRVEQAVDKILAVSRDFPRSAVIFGAPRATKKASGRGLYNSAFFVYQGRIEFIQHKSLLPTYDVFDEARYFDPAPEIKVFKFKNEILGLSLCEDAWNVPELWRRSYYDLDPIQQLARKGARIMINISASPFSIGKEEIRYRIIQTHARKYGVPFLFVNQVAANDELIFDGASMGLNQCGELIVQLASFQEEIRVVDLTGDNKITVFSAPDPIESVYRALVFGITEYMRKCNFQQALIGLSGGIDSAVVACLACSALGPANVRAVIMPGPYSSPASAADARQLAGNLGIGCDTIGINSLYQEYLRALQDSFEGRPVDQTEENIQARIRGNILMALANKFGYLVLTTGNKSELAVGYCTLYGDMSGGLAVISDVPKIMIYKLAAYINRNQEIIPRSILVKPPSAELRPNQTDQDTLPPYEILDPILQMYVEDGLSKEEIINKGFEADTVERVIRMVKNSEFKRYQAAPGLKVTSRAFGSGRRLPIAAKY